MERKMHCHRDGAFFIGLNEKICKRFQSKKKMIKIKLL